MITIRQRYRQQTDGQLASASLGKNEALQVRLRQKITVLRNARRRERRLQGTVSNLLQTLKDQKLLSDQATTSTIDRSIQRHPVGTVLCRR